MKSSDRSSFLLLLVSGLWVVAQAADPPASSPSSSPAPAPTPPPPPPYAYAQSCGNGVALQYTIESVEKSYPHLTDATEQPWTFKATAQLINTGEEDVKGWQLYIGYHYNEVLVSATGALLGDGSSLPARVGNGTVLTSSSQSILKTAIETAMDTTKMGITIPITGTEFGEPKLPMPTNISLLNDGYTCTAPNISANIMDVCCTKENSSLTVSGDDFLPLEKGDITILYDVTQSFTDHYLAQVTISNDNPIGRLDFWNLLWDWQYGEFIYSMKGAETLKQDQSSCIEGPAGTFYGGIDFSQVMNCEVTPTIVDLDQYKANDSNVGKIPFCCRNGTLLPTTMDATRSKSVFQLQVYKLPPHNTDRKDIDPPINWNVSGSFDTDYTCGQPRLVEPSQYPDPSSSVRTEAAFITWQVTCNISKPQITPPKCCVSFSTYFNDSVVPCKTCACGCQSRQLCSQSAEALLIPSEVLPLPFVNRTTKTLAWAHLKHWTVPNPLPCGDNCGVSINWHIYSDYTNGWTARISILNWERLQFPDWFSVVELNKTFAGFEKAYSFNGSAVPGMNYTLFMQGLPGLNYLNAYGGYPGLQQSMLSFTKKGFKENLLARDYFPSKVFFNGDECALPDIIPTGSAWHLIPRALSFLVPPVLVLIFGPFGQL